MCVEVSVPCLRYQTLVYVAVVSGSEIVCMNCGESGRLAFSHKIASKCINRKEAYSATSLFRPT